jgi:Tol biopolymer transport system component
MIVSMDGAPPREVLRVKTPQRISILAWTPDSRRVLVRKFMTTATAPSEVWAVSIADGTARKLPMNPDIITPGSPTRFHPDGRQVVFLTGQGKREVQVIESIPGAMK